MAATRKAAILLLLVLACMAVLAAAQQQQQQKQQVQQGRRQLRAGRTTATVDDSSKPVATNTKSKKKKVVPAAAAEPVDRKDKASLDGAEEEEEDMADDDDGTMKEFGDEIFEEEEEEEEEEELEEEKELEEEEMEALEKEMEAEEKKEKEGGASNKAALTKKDGAAEAVEEKGSLPKAKQDSVKKGEDEEVLAKKGTDGGDALDEEGADGEVPAKLGTAASDKKKKEEEEEEEEGTRQKREKVTATTTTTTKGMEEEEEEEADLDPQGGKKDNKADMLSKAATTKGEEDSPDAAKADKDELTGGKANAKGDGKSPTKEEEEEDEEDAATAEKVGADEEDAAAASTTAKSAGTKADTPADAKVQKGATEEETEAPNKEAGDATSEAKKDSTEPTEVAGDGPKDPSASKDADSKKKEPGQGPNIPDPSAGQAPLVTTEAAASAACDADTTCNGHGRCEDDGSCHCFPPYTGTACLRDACLDIYDCGDCVGSTLGCYFFEGECRGDGLMTPEESTCRPQWLLQAFTYLQFAFLFGVVLLVAGCLVWRSRRASSGSSSGFLRMPTNTSTAGPDGDTNWQWDPEEDNVELLKQQQQQQQGGGGRPEAYSDQSKSSTGIYALIRSPGKQTGASPGKPQQPVAINTVAQRRESAGPAPPSADDLFAELGMEARPNFKKDGSPGRGTGSSTTRSSRLSAAAVGTSPVKSAGAGFAPGWIDDEDLDL